MRVAVTGATGFIGSHAAIEAFGGTGRPYLQISGARVYGDNISISEDSPFNPPALVGGTSPSTAGGGKVPGLLLVSPREDAGKLVMLGTGRQHWSTVHVADLADFFRRVLEDESAGGRYIVADGSNPTIAELTEAAAVAVGAQGAVPGSDDEARARLGDYFAEILLLDQGADAARARAELGWRPSPPRLVDEFRTGSYGTVGSAR